MIMLLYIKSPLLGAGFQFIESGAVLSFAGLFRRRARWMENRLSARELSQSVPLEQREQQEQQGPLAPA